MELMPAAICDLPYEGAKEMLLVDEVDSKAFLTKLFEAMYDELPYQNKNKKKQRSAVEITFMGKGKVKLAALEE